jgi:transcriptional regulator with XRE-family HTH domain
MKTLRTPETLEDCIGMAIREVRRARGLTQVEFCRQFGLAHGQSSVAHWEAGDSVPPVSLPLRNPEIYVKATEIAEKYNLLEVPVRES